MADDRPEVRRTFVPVASVGVTAALLCAVAGQQPWAQANGGTGTAESGRIEFATGPGPGESPAAGALALVVLACWGVILVSRGRFRRAVAVLAVLAAGVVVAVVAVGFVQTPDAVREAVSAVGVVDPDVSRTAWYWVAALSALVSVAAAALAVRWAPGWPEMGRRYDGPGAAIPAPTTGEPTDADLWKAMDEGRDPTL